LEPKTPRILAEFKAGLDNKAAQSSKQILINDAWKDCCEKEVKKKNAKSRKRNKNK
jgi:hypothetical protein